MYKKILILSLITIQTSCATYKEPQGNESTLAIAKGSYYRKSFCEVGSVVISEIDGKTVSNNWTVAAPKKILPGKHQLKLSSKISLGCSLFKDFDYVDTKITTTLHAGNEYQFFSEEKNKQMNITIVDKNGTKIPFDNLGSSFVNNPNMVHIIILPRIS